MPLLMRLPYIVGLLPLSDCTTAIHILMQATTFAIAVFGLTVVLGLCGQINLAQAAFFGFGAYAVGFGTADLHLNLLGGACPGRGRRAGDGRILGMTTLRLGGHYLAMVTISFQQIVTLVMINWIRLTHGPTASASIGARRCSNRNARLSGLLRRDAGADRLFRLASAAYAARPRDARGARQRTRGRRRRHRRLPHQGLGLRACAVLGGIGGGLFAGGFAYVSPDQFSLRRVDRVPDDVAARRRGVADRRGDRHRALDPDSGMAAVPQERSGALSGDLRIVGHPDHPLHAGRHLGFVSSATGAGAPSCQGAARPRLRSLLKPATIGGAIVLEVTGLSKYFGGLKAVDDVDIEVRRGGVHALIGPNGSGKTTTLNVLSGLYKATAGRVVLDGTDVTDCRRICARPRGWAARSRTSACSAR
jgi:branched-chain amino acid transport system permease protein